MIPNEIGDRGKHDIRFDPLDLPCFSLFQLDCSLRETLLTDHKVVGRADEIGIVELDPRPFVPIIPQHFNPRVRQRVVKRLSRVCDLSGLA